MTDASDPIPRGRLLALLGIATVLSAVALLGIASPWGAGITRDLGSRPAGQQLMQPVRIALPEPGFRTHVDPLGRFSLPIPADFSYEIEGDGGWRLRGPIFGGLETYILIMVQPLGPGVGLPELDRLRDDEIRRKSDLPYTKLTTTEGTLDGLPALNRAFRLGGYQGWEVLIAAAAERHGWVACFTFVCHEREFPERELVFRKLLAGFRTALPAAAPDGTAARAERGE